MSTVPFGSRLSSDMKLAGRVYPRCVPRTLTYPRFPAWGLLARAAANVPDRTASSFLGHRLSYSEVNQASIRLAAWLQGRGIGAGDRVGILLPNTPEYLIALNGIWRAGGVAVAISPLSVADDVARLLATTDCNAVICLDVLTGLLKQADRLDHTLLVSLQDYLPSWKRFAYLAARWHRTGQLTLPSSDDQTWLWDAIGQTEAVLRPVETLPASDPAYILSTGGTTGSAKAVTLSHSNIVANAWQQAAWAGGSMGEETMLAVLPFFHSYGMSSMIAAGPALGATLIMQPRFNTASALTAIGQHRPTVFHAVPAMLASMNRQLRKRPADLSSLKWVISGGASLSVEVANEFTRHSGAMVVEGYGLSEASPVTHVGPLDGSNITGTIGLPLPDTECRIVDIESGKRELPAGEVGELVVRGPQIMLGYWNNPSATDQCLRDGWLFTGDLASRDASGFFRIVDRKKDLIITSGFNVYPADVEETLRGCDEIADVAVIGVPHAERGEIVKAFVVLKPGFRWNRQRLERFCREKLSAQRRPLAWEHVQDDLPRNFLGKVIRRELRELSTGGAS